MSTATILYATDEDIALRASADYALLWPKDQKFAAGSDGVFSASSPWTLTSATVDFQGQGVMPGQLVQLEKLGSSLRPGGEGFVVVGVSPGSATLRRKGQPIGVGQPPAPPTGLTGVEFSIVTFGPQIVLATDDLNRRFGITTGAYAGRSAGELADPSELRDAAVLTVLYRQYLDMSRELSAPTDTFATKAQIVKAELDDRLDRLALHWNRYLTDPEPGGPTTRFSTRMSR